MRISLKAARTNVNLTQKQAGVELGVTAKTVASWEKGTSYPTIDKIPAICELYGRSYDEIQWQS